MPKATFLLFFVLTAISMLLIGVQIGRKTASFSTSPPPSVTNQQVSPSPLPQPTPTTTPRPTSSQTSQSSSSDGSTSTFSDRRCGYSFSFPGSFMKQKTVNEKSTIFTDPDDATQAIAATCASSLPKPPLPDSKKESITMDNQIGTLYHDQNPDVTPRDEVFVKHPTNGMEIIIAGYGATFEQALSSFKFIR